MMRHHEHAAARSGAAVLFELLFVVKRWAHVANMQAWTRQRIHNKRGQIEREEELRARRRAARRAKRAAAAAAATATTELPAPGLRAASE
jgi:hypothetical protein